MPAIILSDNGATSGSAGLKTSGGNDGVLQLQTTTAGGTPTTAISISNTQVVTYTNQPTYTGGTANGVLYLNGSKVVTSGSALVFDGTNLGVGVTPSAWASSSQAVQNQAGALFTVGAGSLRLFQNAYYNSATNNIYVNTAAASGYIQAGGEHQWFNAPSGTAGATATFTQAMMLNASGNLGVGTSSPACKVDANGVIRAQGATIAASGEGIELIYTTSTPWYAGNQGLLQAYNRGGSAYTPLSFSGSVLYFSTGGSGRATLDANGNLGLGVTPASGWQSSRKAMQIGQSMAFDCFGTSQAVIRSNSYYNGTNDIYINTAASAAYEQSSGTHRWYSAGSGTAGNIISYTQYMMLDTSGRLGINTTPTNRPLEIAGAGTLGTQIKITNSGSSAGVQMNGVRAYEIQSDANSEFIVYDRTAEAYRMRITSTGVPLFPNLPMFYAYTTSGPATTSTGPIAFNLTRVNNGSYYNTSNGRFTAPVAGTYMFTVRLLLRTNGVAGSGEATLYLNGGNLGARGKAYGAGAISNGHLQQEATVIITLAAGDYVQGAVYSISAGMDFYYADELGAFCGQLLG